MTTNSTQTTAIGANAARHRCTRNCRCGSLRPKLVIYRLALVQLKIIIIHYTTYAHTDLATTSANIDKKLISFTIGTTTHLESLDTSIVNIGTTLNSQSNRIK